MSVASSHVRFRSILTALALLVLSQHRAGAATIPVSDDASLTAALVVANPGDTIVLADGVYSGFTMARSGTAFAPITIRAAHPLGATIATGVVHLQATSYVTLSGLTITTAGGAQLIDEESIKVAVWLEATQQCRVTRSRFALSGQGNDTQWILLSGRSEHNRVDHNELGPNSVDGHMVWPRGRRTIDGVTPPADRTPWAEGEGPVNANMARYTRIDHNYFHDQAAGTGETIVLGGLGVTGDYQDTYTTIEDNLFENVDGDAEYISVKASSNTIRYNTVRTSVGTISLRAGNKNEVYGNFLLQGLKAGSGGIKMQEKDHRIFNNYVEGSGDYPIFIGDGNAYNLPGFSHAQTFRAWIVNNTVVDGLREVRMGRTTRPLPPTDCVFVNNLIVRFVSDPDPLYRESGGPVNLDRAGNIVWPTAVSQSGFSQVDPLLARVGEVWRPAADSPVVDAGDPRFLPLVFRDIDGQLRRTAPDVGADEQSSGPAVLRPLTAADVGPAVADATDPQFLVLFPWPPVLWPANHQMVPVQLLALVFDRGDRSPVTRITAVSSSEPTEGTDAGDLSPDWEVTGDLTLLLRAERAPSGPSPGRIYTITVESRDATGNAATRTTQVVVPR